MSNGIENEIIFDESASEIENSSEAVSSVQTVASQILKDEGDQTSAYSSATATPLERSQETSQEVDMKGPIEFKEWDTLINLLARIPVKAQKGLSTLDLKLTCISTMSGAEEILVLGTNVGIVYWYNRRFDALDRLRCEGINAITSLNCISTVDYMVAAGNQAGIVTIFQIPKDPVESNSDATSPELHERKIKKSQRFLIQDLHKGAVTALEWSRNGMKLFSADQTGHVVVTDIDYDLVQIRSSILLCENYEVVQLSYARRNLLICSTFRSVIYSLESKNFIKVGSTERKVMGKFGGLIVSSAWEESPNLYSARPGARLWVADLSGVVKHTIKFKELLLAGSPEIHVIKPLKTQRQISQDLQFTRVFRFMKDYLVTYYKDILHIIDPRNTLVLGTCRQLRSILDVAVNKDEIFILESPRNVIRISAKADKHACLTSNFLSGNLLNHSNLYTSPKNPSNSNSSAFQQYDDFAAGIKNIPDIMSASISDFKFPQEPINFLTSKFKETSTKVINSTLITTIKTAIEADVDIEDGQRLLDTPPPVIAVEDGDFSELYSPQQYDAEPVFIPEPERFQKITNLPFEDVLVETAKPKRKKGSSKSGKLKTKPFGAASANDGATGNNEGASDTVSLSSVYSNTSSDNNASTSTGGLGGVSSSASSSVRKLSFKSDVTLSSSNSGSEGVTDKLGIPVAVSQSWTIGTLLPNKTVTTEEIHLKEEMLARRLKWPELLPDNVSPDVLLDEPFGIKPAEDVNVWEVNIPHKNSQREDRSSILTIVGPSYQPSEGDEGESLSMENSTSIGTVIECKVAREEMEVENVPFTSTVHSAEPSSDSSENDEDKYYVDIYNRFRTKESSDSFNSVLSFGPPSGSSHVSAGNSITNGNQLISNSIEDAHSSQTGNASQANNNVSSFSEELDNSKELSGSTTTTTSSTELLESIVESKVVSDEHWRKWRLPGPIVQITMCDQYITCVGSKNIVYYAQLDTVGLQWKTTNYSASSMALSPCGSVVWRIYKGDLYSLTNSTGHGPVGQRGEQWSKLSSKKEVICATVQRSFGWVVKCDGSLEFCTGFLETRLVPYFENVYTPWPIQEVSSSGHRLWALTSDGRIVYRSGTSDLNPKGIDWIELRWNVTGIAAACTMSCGENNANGASCVWFADSDANLYFTFDERDSKGGWTPWKVSTSNCVVSPPPQSKSVLLNSIKEQVSKSFKSLVQTKSDLALCSSKYFVWFAGAESSLIHGNRSSAIGHCWKPLRIDRGIIVPASWTSIYANSIYKGHGNLWISDSKGYLFYLPQAGGKLQQIDLPMFTDGQIMTVAAAPEALWVLTSTGDIHGRCGITSSDSVGKGWRQISLSTLKSTQFVHISCGSEVVWAVDDKGEVYMRIGSLKPPGAHDMSPAWNKVESSVCCKGVFTKVYVGANDSMVWALDAENRIYVRQAVFPDYPIGTGWLWVKGIDAVMLSISDVSVWALSTNGSIYTRQGISKTNCVGDYWRKLPGSASTIAVSLCDELWVLQSNGYLLKHSSMVIKLKGCDITGNTDSNRNMSRCVLDKEDEDWELVDNSEF